MSQTEPLIIKKHHSRENSADSRINDITLQNADIKA